MSVAITPLGSIPPWAIDPSAQWLSVKEFAALYSRTPRRVQQMLRSGDIMIFGVATYLDERGKWWIRLPK